MKPINLPQTNAGQFAQATVASHAGRSKGLRVLHLIPSMHASTGGVAEAVVQLVRHMQPFGAVSEVVTLDAPSTDDATHFSRVAAPVHCLGPGLGFYGLSLTLVRWLRTNRSRFDAFIVHGIWQFHSFAAWCGVFGSSTPLFIFPHGMLDPWFQRAYPAKHLKKIAYWNLLERWVFARAERVLFTCKTELELARRPFLSPRHRLSVNGFGIDMAPIEIDPEESAQAFRAAFPAIGDKRILLFLSRIHVKKGCDLLVDAFALIAELDRQVCLVIAGPSEPALLEQLKAAAEAHGIADRIVWTGMLEGHLKWGALHAAEVFVLPSHQENFGIAVVEALASGTPVIVTDRVNIWAEIEATGGGLICTDTAASVNQVLRKWVLEMSPAERAAMRVCAFECYAQHFRIESAARALVLSVQDARSAA
jgi:glycosyltransferase involved in cell wall biosynthesis